LRRCWAPAAPFAGVSASIAIAGAVGAKKEYAPIAITVVILWAIAMIFALPFASLLLRLPTGVAGRMDRHFRIRRCGGLCRGTDLRRFRRPRAGNRRRYAGYRFPPEIIQQAIWLYVRFTLSFRDVEDLLAERGIITRYHGVLRNCPALGEPLRTDDCGEPAQTPTQTLYDLAS
jgi:hypothetical protein